LDTSLRLLLIEDSEEDAQLLLRELQRAGYQVTHARVDTAASLNAVLDRQTWDLAIGDYSMPQFSGMEALRIIQERGLDLPFISVSGTITEEMAVAAMRAGAKDYVTKGHLKRLLPAIERELREWKARASLRDTETSYATLVAFAPIGIYRSTPAGKFLTVNAALVRMLGYDSFDEVLTLDMGRDVYAHVAERQRLLDRDTYTDRQYDDVEATWKRKDGRPLQVQLSVRAVRNAAGQIDYYETFVRDVTEQRRLQQQLTQSQKMEAVGRLAGGIAHDFNNLLTVITSYSELLLQDLSRDDPRRDDVEQVRKAADGAAALTRQLLSFSRQQVIEPKAIDLNTVVENLKKILQRVIGEDVELATVLAPDLRAVRADVSQIEQILMNLAVNARDAMPTGGKLTIETNNVLHGPERAQPFVMLAVTDTGTGMDEATKARIFEPFFTTKQVGKGTGLGLATVYAIVTQGQGLIWVYSELGHGTSVKIYLPQVDAIASSAASDAPMVVPRGTETVLLVEDAAAVRAVAKQTLVRQGYQVLEASDGEDALHIAKRHRGPIDLVLTDVVMPRVGGRELVERLSAVRPDVRVLFMSGYTDDSVVRHGILEGGVPYLQKPFAPDGLARKVRDVLDAQPAQKRVTPTGAHVLVIDDDPGVRVAIRRALERKGFVVREAADGEDGMQVYRAHGAAIVVVDIFMPGRDGLEFIRALRAEAPGTAIIAISGGGDILQMDMLKAAKAFGAARTIVKPIDVQELLAAMRDLLGDKSPPTT
jgi:two-component system cell cycle sensor histidine kinase/response regulator CckA